MRYLLVPLFMLAALACQGSATAQIRHGLCNDYGSRTDYQGNRYYIRDPENGRVVRQHWGMDFCTKAGTNVLAAADGTVHDIVTDNPVRGGQIILKSTLKGPASRDQKEIIYLRHLHITPDPKLKWGYTVRAGQVIGTVQKGGKEQIGPRAHVHFDAGKCPDVWLCPVDPNLFWSGGLRQITCFDPKAPPAANKLVAPIPC